MAHSDYQQRGSGFITPKASLVGGIGPGQTIIPIENFTADVTTLPAVGTGAMMGREIVKVIAISFDSMTVERGCADTIPAIQLPGTPIWFFDSDDRIGTDNREYIATETIGVKVLMRTSGAQMEPKNSPPNALTFNHRFIRPYPPGRMEVNGTPWWQGTYAITEETPSLNFAWTHRDRITQDDQLIGHLIDSIGPETGTEYVIRVYRQDNTLARTVVTTAASWNLSRSALLGDLAGSTSGYVTIQSRRDGYESFQNYRVDVSATSAGGWGSNWGNNWGG